MSKIESRVAKLEVGLNSQQATSVDGIWLVGVSSDGSSQLGRFLPIGRTDAERRKNRSAGYDDAGLNWIPSTN